MLRHESDINGYAIHASDGPIGTVRDFLFDDATWKVRWLLIDTGGWLPGREILLPPSAVAQVNHVGHQFNVNLTKQQVKDCPDVDSHLPVSRQQETNLYDYYGWSPYWGDGAYMDLVGYGGGDIAQLFVPATARGGSSAAQRLHKARTSGQDIWASKPNPTPPLQAALRTANFMAELTGVI